MTAIFRRIFFLIADFFWWLIDQEARRVDEFNARHLKAK